MRWRLQRQAEVLESGKHWGEGKQSPKPTAALDRVHVLPLRGRPVHGPRELPGARSGSYADRPVPLPGWWDLWRAVEETGAQLVMLDPALGAFVGEANAAAAVREFLMLLAEEADLHDAGVLIVAHSRKAARSKDAAGDDVGHVAGSTHWVDGVRGVLTLHREGERDDRHHVLRVAKANYGPSELECRLTPITIGSVGTAGGMPVAFKAGPGGWMGFGAKSATSKGAMSGTTPCRRRTSMPSDPPTLQTARTDTEVLEAVARAVWAKDHPDDKCCPPDKVPTGAEFARFVDALPADSAHWEALQPYHLDRLGTMGLEAYRSLHEEAERGWLAEREAKRRKELTTAEALATPQGLDERKDRVRALLKVFREDPATPPEVLQGLEEVLSWGQPEAAAELEGTQQRLAAEADRETSRQRLSALLSGWREDRLYALGGSFTLEELHVLWQVYRGLEEDRERYPSDEAFQNRSVTPHPLAVLIRAWQERPVPGRAEHRPTGIMPLVLGTAQGALFDEAEGRLAAALGAQGGRIEQGHLFSELVSSTVLAPWLALVDATGMPIGTRGRGHRWCTGSSSKPRCQ